MNELNQRSKQTRIKSNECLLGMIKSYSGYIILSLERRANQADGTITSKNNKAFYSQHLSFHWGVMSALPGDISVKRCSMPRDGVEKGILGRHSSPATNSWSLSSSRKV